MKRTILAGVFGLATISWGLGFAPSVSAQGMMDGLTGLLGAQDSAGNEDNSMSTPSPFTLPDEPSVDQQDQQEGGMEPPLPDTGEGITPGPGVPEQVSPVLPGGEDAGVVPGEVPVTPTQPVF